MADDPVFKMVGVGALGVGVVMLYAAYKNVSVFGKNGLITQALTTGSFANVATLPKLFASGGNSGSTNSNVPDSVIQAIRDIASKDQRLANDISDQLTALANGNSSYNQDKLNGLLDAARKEGMSGPAKAISDYVAGRATQPNANTQGGTGVWT